MEYDGTVIGQFADKLYKRANSTIVVYSVIGLFIGLFVGAALFSSTKSGLLFLATLLVCGAIGYAIGLDKAFLLKFQAQLALGLAKIEANTRKS